MTLFVAIVRNAFHKTATQKCKHKYLNTYIMEFIEWLCINDVFYPPIFCCCWLSVTHINHSSANAIFPIFFISEYFMIPLTYLFTHLFVCLFVFHLCTTTILWSLLCELYNKCNANFFWVKRFTRGLCNKNEHQKGNASN